MTTKKQKRLAGEARKREADAMHEAEIAARKAAADARARRRAERDAEQARQASRLKAINALRPRS